MNLDLYTLKSLLMWCSIINFACLIFSFFMVILIKQWAFRIHSTWFEIPYSTWQITIYCFYGVYKILWFMFNLVPYIALEIMI